MDLKNNVALVTGGASGLGRGTVEHFVSKGCKVAILDINDEKAKEVIDLLGEENVAYFNTDVMNEDSVKNAIKGIKENFQKLNFIVIKIIHLIKNKDKKQLLAHKLHY